MIESSEGSPSSTPRETALPEVRRFSDEAREALGREGFRIFTLTGQSLRSLKEQGRKFHGFVHDEAVETQPSMVSEVALMKSGSIIDQSHNKTLKQQEGMIAKFSRDLRKKVKGVEAVMGEPTDYAELAFLRPEWATTSPAREEHASHIHVRTKNPRVTVAIASSNFGLEIDDMSDERAAGHISACPLVVPKS